MKSFLIIAYLFSFLFASHAFAYIPRTQTIVKKMSSNSGSREYKIVREVTLQANDQQIRARETWTVANGDKMKLKVSSMDQSNPWEFVIYYGSKQRRTLSSSGKIKTFKKSREFFEPLFHDRFHKSLMSRLVNYNFVPQWIKDTPAPTVKDGETMMTPEPFISLEPMEGSVSYAIGAPRRDDGSRAQTQIWVEQDSFLIKKGRLGSGAEFVNNQFQTFPGGLKLPSEQQIVWNDRMAKVKLLAVERTKTNKKDWQLKAGESGSLPSDSLIKEFYSRFR